MKKPISFDAPDFATPFLCDVAGDEMLTKAIHRMQYSKRNVSLPLTQLGACVWEDGEMVGVLLLDMRPVLQEAYFLSLVHQGGKAPGMAHRVKDVMLTLAGGNKFGSRESWREQLQAIHQKNPSEACVLVIDNFYYVTYNNMLIHELGTSEPDKDDDANGPIQMEHDTVYIGIFRQRSEDEYSQILLFCDEEGNSFPSYSVPKHFDSHPYRSQNFFSGYLSQVNGLTPYEGENTHGEHHHLLKICPSHPLMAKETDEPFFLENQKCVWQNMDSTAPKRVEGYDEIARRFFLFCNVETE